MRRKRLRASTVHLGGNPWIGLEDNLYLDRGVFATNAQLVEKARDGGVNKHGQAHDIANLFISDGSQFTTGASENPTLTIVALAIRQADYTAEQVESDLGPITGLVNNAGVHGPRGRLEALSADDISHVLAVNVTGYFICAREAIKRMSTKHGGKGGAIVNISSGAAKLGGAGEGVLYAASKGAVNSLTIGLSQEVAGEGIRVNAVAPGLTRTDMPSPDKLETLGPGIPIGRIAEPEEIAEAVMWLLSEKASYTTGANIRVGGGRIG